MRFYDCLICNGRAPATEEETTHEHFISWWKAHCSNVFWRGLQRWERKWSKFSEHNSWSMTSIQRMGDILAFTCITAGKKRRKTHFFPNVILTTCFKHKNASIKPMVDVRSAVIPLNGALTAIHNHSMLDRTGADEALYLLACPLRCRFLHAPSSTHGIY